MALPVVDSEGYLLGVVKPDEILEALQQEAFADLQKMVGAGEDEKALSPVSVVVRKRLPWLYVNLATAFVAAAVVGLFESTIEKVTALAASSRSSQDREETRGPSLSPWSCGESCSARSYRARPAGSC